MNQQKRNELITEMHNDIKWLKEIMGNHLQHHSRLFFWVLGVMSTIVIALAATLFRLITN